MIKLETLFDLNGIEMRRNTRGRKPKQSDQCVITMNKSGAGKKLTTRYCFHGKPAEMGRNYTYVTYGVSPDGTIHFFFGCEKFDSTSSYKIQKDLNNIYFNATPESDKEEKCVRGKLANKGFDVHYAGTVDNVLHLFIKFSSGGLTEQEEDHEQSV